MKTVSTHTAARISASAFTLIELMVATAVGIGLAGTVVLLLVQSATEQRNGFADTTVEEKAYTLQANITACLRSMSASMGLTPDYSSGVMNSGGNLLGYQSVSVFYPTNGAYLNASISYNSSSGSVIYTPNVSIPSTRIVWMTNSATAALTGSSSTSRTCAPITRSAAELCGCVLTSSGRWPAAMLNAECKSAR